jgi:predicted GNAT superfamily acetyltransferase
MAITIRPVRTPEEYLAAEYLQREAWGRWDISTSIISRGLLVAVQENGGLVLGAFDAARTTTLPPEHPLAAADPTLVGFVFGFIGLKPDGGLKHCSHMAGVLPTYQNQDIGYHLKCAQREYVLAQGIDLIIWTYDPMQSRNAYFNLHKLGTVCNTMLPNLYGFINDALNAGLPTHRFEVAWHIASPHVADRLAGRYRSPSLADLLASGICLLNPDPPDSDDLLPGRPTLAHLSGEPVLIQIPSDFRAVKEADMELAQRWQQQVHDLFNEAFAHGYQATDLLVAGKRSYYMLEKESER